MSGTKICAICKQRLSTAAFHRSQRSADQLATTCRACTNAARRERDRLRKSPRRPGSQQAKLWQALRAGDVPAVQASIRDGAQPEVGWLCEATRAGHHHLAHALLDAGVEHSVFTMAAIGDLAGLKRKLSRVPSDAQVPTSMPPGCVNVTPLHIACAGRSNAEVKGEFANQAKLAELLMRLGASPSATATYRGIENVSPLFCACWTSENVALVRCLLQHGAQPAMHDLLAALGHFQKHHAPNFEIAALLLQSGLRIDGTAPDERTPLQAFASQGVRATVAWLIAHGAGVNARGPGGRTAAHFAAERNTRPTTLALLVEHGADLQLRDDDGHTPYDTAQILSKTRVAQWLSEQSRS